MSSFLGPTMAGKRSRSAAMISTVSSTESVVWVMKATRSGSGMSSSAISSTVPIRRIASGASPIVPTTSSWPSWPISTIV